MLDNAKNQSLLNAAVLQPNGEQPCLSPLQWNGASPPPDYVLQASPDCASGFGEDTLAFGGSETHGFAVVIDGASPLKKSVDYPEGMSEPDRLVVQKLVRQFALCAHEAFQNHALKIEDPRQLFETVQREAVEKFTALSSWHYDPLTGGMKHPTLGSVDRKLTPTAAFNFVRWDLAKNELLVLGMGDCSVDIQRASGKVEPLSHNNFTSAISRLRAETNQESGRYPCSNSVRQFANFNLDGKAETHPSGTKITAGEQPPPIGYPILGLSPECALGLNIGISKLDGQDAVETILLSTDGLVERLTHSDMLNWRIDEVFAAVKARGLGEVAAELRRYEADHHSKQFIKRSDDIGSISLTLPMPRF